MKSIANQYRDLKEGKMSQANFMRNLRMSMPQYVTNVTSFNDAIRILKSKSILTENINLKPEDEKEIKVDGEEEILALLDKIEQEKAGEEAIMSQYDPMEEDQLTEGKGKELHPNQIHPSELRMGIKVEMEHTDDPKKAEKIALDHLAENPYYYTALKLSGVESPSKPKEKAKKEVKAKKKKESTQLVDLVNGMKKVKMPKTVKEAMEVNPQGQLNQTLPPDVKRIFDKMRVGNVDPYLSTLNTLPEYTSFFTDLYKKANEIEGELTDQQKDMIEKISQAWMRFKVTPAQKDVNKTQPPSTVGPKVAKATFGAPQQQALSKNLDSLLGRDKLKEMVRQELAEYEKGDEGDGVPSKKTAAREITDKAVDYIDDYNEGESKEYKKKWLDNVFDSYEDKVGHRYDNDVFQDVIDMLKAKGYTMSMKETFDGRDNLIDPIAAIEK